MLISVSGRARNLHAAFASRRALAHRHACLSLVFARQPLSLIQLRLRRKVRGEIRGPLLANALSRLQQRPSVSLRCDATVEFLHSLQSLPELRHISGSSSSQLHILHPLRLSFAFRDEAASALSAPSADDVARGRRARASRGRQADGGRRTDSQNPRTRYATYFCFFFSFCRTIRPTRTPGYRSPSGRTPTNSLAGALCLHLKDKNPRVRRLSAGVWALVPATDSAPAEGGAE